MTGAPRDVPLPLQAIDGEPIDEWPVLTVRQPWAWAIAHAGKDTENRSWMTRYRGPILIHASKRVPAPIEFGDLFALLDDTAASELDRAELNYGAIVASARLADVVRESGSPWFVGPFGWVLTDVRPLERPIVRPGRQGIYTTRVLRGRIGRAPEELA